MFVFEIAIYVLERRRVERRRLLALMLRHSGKSDLREGPDPKRSEI